MWCSSCRQEVPGVTSPVDGKHACPRCGILLGLDSGLDLADFTPELLAEAERVAPIKPREPLPDFKPVKPPQAEPVRISSLRWEAANWELNEKLRHVERVTATARRRYDDPSPQSSAGPHFALPYIPAQPALIPRAEAEPPAFAPPPRQPYGPPAYAPQYPSPHSPSGPQDPYPSSPAPESAPHEWNELDDRPRPGVFAASVVSWIFLGIATTAFSCGGFLAAWGAVAEREALQRLGMPILLGGVLALVVGVLPQLMLKSLEDERKRREAAAHAAWLAAKHDSEHQPESARRPSHYERRAA